MAQRHPEKAIRRTRRVRPPHRAPGTIALPYEDVLLRSWEVARRTGLVEKVLASHMHQGFFPPYSLVGGIRVLLQSQLDGLIATRMHVRDAMPCLKADPILPVWSPDMVSARDGLPTGMRLLRISDLTAQVSRTPGWVYWLMSRDPSFPRPVPLTFTARGWVAHEVERWLGSHSLGRAA